ncbi:MAG: helicase-related protein [Bryobacteraceae bacterium]|nr:helicase-related protein [Bryobacteraceae bacterium]
MKPDFIDNRDGNTLQRALLAYLSAQRQAGDPVEDLWIATAYFNPEGLELLVEETQHVPHIRLLLGADPTPEPLRPVRQPGDPQEPEFTRREVQRAMQRLSEALARDRDLLPFSPYADAAIRRLVEFLRSGRIEVRLYRQHFLHAKAFIFRARARGLIAGSSNLTRAGLRSNMELNLGHYDMPVVGKVEGWYEALWEQAEPFDLAAIYEQLLNVFTPYEIYLKILWHLYGAELEAERTPDGTLGLTTFQQHGVWRALNIIARYGGVLVADGVGLGKTFIAGEIMRRYRERRQRVLLIAPAALRDGTWKRFLHRHQLLVDVVSFEQLAADHQLGGEHEHLPSPLDEYALVVVDEAHHYRNPDTRARAGVLRRLLTGPRRDVVLLTATPVNNSLWDLYHLLRFFIKQDAFLADRGLLSMRERFEQAMKIDPFDLSPDLLFPIIDATTVKRPRSFVKKYYESDAIRHHDGTLVPIRFPKPKASTLEYDFDAILPGFFDRFADDLAPDHGPPRLTLARYQPQRYLGGLQPDGEDTALVGLIRSALLKRFESSVHAFACTCERMITEHEAFLDALDRGYVLTTELVREWSAADDEDIEDFVAERPGARKVQEFNGVALRRDVKNDLKLLRQYAREARTVQPRQDPKLARLADELATVVREAEQDALDAEETQQLRKVLVFSQFEETIDWIYEFLVDAVRTDSRLAAYRERIVRVAGARGGDDASRQEAIYGFAPVSSEAPPGRDADRYDLMLSTDVLAEGVNLQQCRNIINFDLPWNPMRLVQRHGRIDRIGSPHKVVYLRTFFPAKGLDRLLRLEERIRRKLAQAAASVGLEGAPIAGVRPRELTFSETRTEIEKLQREEADLFERGGTRSAAQTGEEYRQELRRALATRRAEIESIPWKAGSGMRKGERTGHAFAAQIGDRLYLRFVPADPNEEIVTEPGAVLRLIEATPEMPTVLSETMHQAVFPAWERARQSIYEAWMAETDPANLQPRLRPLNREIAEHLRAVPPDDISDEEMARVLDAVESPWSRREENALREVFDVSYPSAVEKSKALVAEIRRLGIEPFRAPEPLPPIELNDVHLVAWMAIEAAAGQPSTSP